MVELLLSCLLDSEILKGTSYSSSVSVLCIVSSQQILANPMEAVSICYMKYIVLAAAGGGENKNLVGLHARHHGKMPSTRWDQ